MKVKESHTMARHLPERRGLRPVKGGPDPLEMRHSADKEYLPVRPGKLLKGVRHPRFASSVFYPAGRLGNAAKRIIVSRASQAVHGIGIRQGLTVHRVFINVRVNVKDRNVFLKTAANRLDQWICGHDREIDRILLLRLITYNRNLRQPLYARLDA
jgi:hypothetical protein